jgi:signal transduction histidine kinase
VGQAQSPTLARPGASTRTADAKRSHPPEAGSASDLQTLLADAVRRLAIATDAARVYAWTPRPDGGYAVTAAFFSEGRPQSPREADAHALSVLQQRSDAVDLGDAGAELRGLALRHDLSAAAPLQTADDGSIAILLLGGRADPPGRVRPRTLAELQSTTRRMATLVSAALSARRLAKLDEEVRRLNALATLGDLLAEVVHEIRNPLVSMKTFFQLLPQRLDDHEFMTDFRTVAASELERMERLIDTVIRQARPDVIVATEPGADIPQVLDSVSRLLRQRSLELGVSLELKIDEALPRVSIQEDALRQVILNLVLNALAATPSGTAVSLCARRHAASEPTVTLTIDDRGPGVPPDQRKRIFEPFYSNRPDRAGGLGLAISHRIVTEAAGSLTVEDAPTGGARFKVQLRVYAPSHS